MRAESVSSLACTSAQLRRRQATEVQSRSSSSVRSPADVGVRRTSACCPDGSSRPVSSRALRSGTRVARRRASRTKAPTPVPVGGISMPARAFATSYASSLTERVPIRVAASSSEHVSLIRPRGGGPRGWDPGPRLRRSPRSNVSVSPSSHRNKGAFSDGRGGDHC